MGAMHKQTYCMEYSQVERRRFLVPRCKGSNPFTPTDVDVHTIYMCIYTYILYTGCNAQTKILCITKKTTMVVHYQKHDEIVHTISWYHAIMA